MISLARLSAVTTRVRIGTAVLLLPLYPPAIVAKQVADLDRATGGRLILGVGVGGEYPEEFRACGVPLDERGARTDEAIPLLRRLWDGEPISHDGRFYPMTDVKVHPSPAQSGGPPIVVGGRQEAAMRRAAHLGDGWMPYLYSPRRYAASAATIGALAEEIGRPLDHFGWFAFIFVNIDADGRRAREDAAAYMGGTYRQDMRPIVDRVAAAGTPFEVTQTIQDFIGAGARHFIFMPAPGNAGPAPIVDHLFQDILPGIRSSM